MPHVNHKTGIVAIAVALLFSLIFSLNPVSAATKKVSSTKEVTGKTTEKGYSYVLSQDVNQYLRLSLESKYKNDSQRRVLKVYKLNSKKEFKLLTQTPLEIYNSGRAKVYAKRDSYYGMPVKKGTYRIVIETYFGKKDKTMKSDTIGQFNFYADKPVE